MEILLKRVARRPLYTIGHISINGERRIISLKNPDTGIIEQKAVDVIEDTDRGLRQGMPLAEIKSKKVYGETAIPTGRYKLSLDFPSQKYLSKAVSDPYYRHFDGFMPRLLNVPGYEGILVHPGTDQKSSLGCLIVGLNTEVGKVTRSRDVFKALYDQILLPAQKNGEEVWITVE